MAIVYIRMEETEKFRKLFPQAEYIGYLKITYREDWQGCSCCPPFRYYIPKKAVYWVEGSAHQVYKKLRKSGLKLVTNSCRAKPGKRFWRDFIPSPAGFPDSPLAEQLLQEDALKNPLSASRYWVQEENGEWHIEYSASSGEGFADDIWRGPTLKEVTNV